MTRLIRRATHRTNLAGFLSNPETVAAAVAEAEPPEQLKTWLQRLEKLYGVPFRYLVPNPRMLPNESIRFFQIDFNWLYALIEGACSPGQASDADAVMHRATRGKLHQAAPLHAGATEDAPQHITGFLLRSQVVPGWPKLQVVAFDESGAELPDVIRMERLSQSVLLYMVAGRIDHVVIREPAVGLHFGIDISGNKPLRYVTVPADAPKDTHPGDQMEGPGASPAFRDDTHRVLKINQLAGAIREGLYAAKANNAPDGSKLPFTSAEFALEMVEGTQEVTFQSNLGGKG